MIALFVSSYSRAEAAARHLGSTTRDVDGPFNVLRGEAAGTPIDVYAVDGTADLAYAAARLALRRGSRVLVPITDAVASRAVAEELELPLGGLIGVGSIWDLAGLQPLLQILPDTCEDFPMEVEALLPSGPLHEAAEGIGVGTVSLPMENRFLARALQRSHDIALFDRQMAGYAAAAQDGGGELRAFCRVAGLLGKNGLIRTVPLRAEQEYEEAVALLLGDNISNGG